MSGVASCLYVGEVVHKRLRPVRHALRYRVFNLFVDVDELPELAKRSRIFRHNGKGLLSLHDSDHGPGDGTPLRSHLERLARTVAGGAEVTRFFMFCYPRVLGYVFNPLTVYYGYDADSRLRLTIYEVNNTFGGRKSYVLPVGPELKQVTKKALYVSPFNSTEGRYGFHLNEPGDHLALGITLTAEHGPTMKAYFSGERRPLTDAGLMRCFLGMPLQGFKVIGAIHWEALKLWLKGLPIMPRPRDPAPLTLKASQDTK